jgi:hypothetical protein
MDNQEHGDRNKRRSDPSEIRRRLERSKDVHEPVTFEEDETTDVLDVALQCVRKTLTEQQQRIGEMTREIGTVASSLTKIPTT